MFPLANWISMTDLHFHMGRSEQKGGESRREVVTGKLIFERGHTAPSTGETKGRSRNFRVNCPDSREARIPNRFRNRSIVYGVFLRRCYNFIPSTSIPFASSRIDVSDRSTRRNSSFELVPNGGEPSEISIRTGCTV